jgi:glycosyltransferase involved in cell wall biosynthesis
MRIGINLIPLRPGQMGGHEFYVRSLLEQLLAADSRHQYFLFTAPWNDSSIDFQRGRYRKILGTSASGPEAERDGDSAPATRGVSRWSNRLLGFPTTPRVGARHPLDLHHWVRRLRLDVWFCPMTNLDPRQLPIPTVITVADIQQEFYPEFFSREELNHRALMYAPSCQEATAVITVSQAAKKSLVATYGLPAEKVHCVYEAGVERGSGLARAPALERVRQKYHLPAQYAFYPANMWPHKNHRMLILALHRLRKVYGVRLPVLLTGDDLGQWGTLQEIAGQFQVQEQVRYLGYVAAEDLPPLYAGATLLVFPSLYEGFGLPLLEAMKLGCPVAAANLTSVPEVVGEAALLFDPRNPDSIANALYRLVSDDTLRQTLRARGRERVAAFSWDKAARETLAVFAWARAHHAAQQRAARPRHARLEGVYRDGWATRRVRLDLPNGVDVDGVKLEGLSDYVTYPLVIRMRVSGCRASDLRLDGPGKFTLMGGARKSWGRAPPLTLELRANRDFIPEYAGISADSRRLAYVIERLVLICRGGAEVPLYARPSSSASEVVGGALPSG